MMKIDAKTKVKPSERQCKGCKTVIIGDRLQCPVCRLWQMSNELPSVKQDTTTWLSEAKRREVRRIKTGPWDACFGGGLTYGSVNLIGGEPGAGKSTMAIQIADRAIQVTNRTGLYISSEEAADEILDRAHRLKLKNMHRLRMHDIENESDIEHVIRLHKPSVVIVDSVSGLCGEDMRAAVEFCHAIKRLAVSIDGAVIIVDHITKGGDLAGAMALQHAVDGTFTLFTANDDSDEEDEESDEDWDEDEDDSDAPDVREMFTIKNRNGKARVKVLFQMTENGLVSL